MLGLSLAFILSQDQTLRCRNSLSFIFFLSPDAVLVDGLFFTFPCLTDFFVGRCCLDQFPQRSLSSCRASALRLRPRFLSESECKDRRFFILRQISGRIFLLKNMFFYHLADYQEEKFSSNKQKTRVNKQKRRVNLPLLL